MWADVKASAVVAEAVDRENDHQQRRADERAPTYEELTLIRNPKIVYVGHGKFRVAMTFPTEEKTYALTGVKNSVPRKASPTFNNMREVEQIYLWFLYRTGRMPGSVLKDKVGHQVLSLNCGDNNYLAGYCLKKNCLDFNIFLSKVTASCNGLCNKNNSYNNRRVELIKILRDLATAKIKFPEAYANGKSDDQLKSKDMFIAEILSEKRTEDYKYKQCGCSTYQLSLCGMLPGAVGAYNQLETKRTSLIKKKDRHDDADTNNNAKDKKPKKVRAIKECAAQKFVALTPAHDVEFDEFVAPMAPPSISVAVAESRKIRKSPFDGCPLVKVVASNSPPPASTSSHSPPPASTSSPPPSTSRTSDDVVAKKTKKKNKVQDKQPVAFDEVQVTIPNDPARVKKNKKSKKRKNDDHDDDFVTAEGPFQYPKKKKKTLSTTTTAKQSSAQSTAQPTTTVTPPHAPTPAPQPTRPNEDELAVEYLTANILSPVAPANIDAAATTTDITPATPAVSPSETRPETSSTADERPPAPTAVVTPTVATTTPTTTTPRSCSELSLWTRENVPYRRGYDDCSSDEEEFEEEFYEGLDKD